MEWSHNVPSRHTMDTINRWLSSYYGTKSPRDFSHGEYKGCRQAGQDREREKKRQFGEELTMINGDDS